MCLCNGKSYCSSLHVTVSFDPTLPRCIAAVGGIVGKFAVKWVPTIPPHLAYVATLPCDTLTSAKQAINDKLQGRGIVAAYLRCGGIVNNQIKKGLLLSLRVKKIKIGEHLPKLQAKT